MDLEHCLRTGYTWSPLTYYYWLHWLHLESTHLPVLHWLHWLHLESTHLPVLHWLHVESTHLVYLHSVYISLIALT
jgi:hypothetical protein